MAEEQPHDTLFKETFSSLENAASHLRTVFPKDLVQRVDWSSLTSVSTGFLIKELDTVQADVLLRARLVDGRECYIYVLFEHQSSEDAMMAFRILRYVVCIWADFLKQKPEAKRLPAVIPCVLYHGPRPWKAATEVADLIDLDGASREALGPFLPSLSFQLDDLRAQSAEQIQQRTASALVRLALLALRDAFETGSPLGFLRFRELVGEALEAPSGPDALATLLCYLFKVGDPDPDQVKDFLIEQAGDKGEEAYMTAAERLTKDAAEKAAKKGRAEGRAAVVLKQLELRFSPLPVEAVERVEQATAEQLDVWVERVLSAETLDDVFA